LKCLNGQNQISDDTRKEDDLYWQEFLDENEQLKVKISEFTSEWGLFCGTRCRKNSIQYHILQHSKAVLLKNIYWYLHSKPLGDCRDFSRISDALAKEDLVNQWWRTWSSKVDRSLKFFEVAPGDVDIHEE
jgi:hypothetical protein